MQSVSSPSLQFLDFYFWILKRCYPVTYIQLICANSSNIQKMKSNDYIRFIPYFTSLWNFKKIIVSVLINILFKSCQNYVMGKKLFWIRHFTDMCRTSVVCMSVSNMCRTHHFWDVLSFLCKHFHLTLKMHLTSNIKK